MSMQEYKSRTAKMENYCFILSHISSSKKEGLVKKIKELGGTYLDSEHFDKRASHVICGSLKKTEKFIGACITGKWILTPHFIEDSHEIGLWLEEENYLFKVENKDLLKDQLAQSARRWRIKVKDFKEIPFLDWKVSVLMSVERAVPTKRLLRYGGAQVLSLQTPFAKCANIKDITYVFVDNFHSAYVPELKDFGILCLEGKFLEEFIIKDPPPDHMDYVINGPSPQNRKLISSSTTKKTLVVGGDTKEHMLKSKKPHSASTTHNSAHPAEASCHPETTPNKKNDIVLKGCKRVIEDTQENSHVPIMSPSKRSKLSSLEYLDPNLPIQSPSPLKTTSKKLIQPENLDLMKKKLKEKLMTAMKAVNGLNEVGSKIGNKTDRLGLKNSTCTSETGKQDVVGDDSNSSTKALHESVKNDCPVTAQAQEVASVSPEGQKLQRHSLTSSIYLDISTNDCESGHSGFKSPKVKTSTPTKKGGFKVLMQSVPEKKTPLKLKSPSRSNSKARKTLPKSSTGKGNAVQSLLQRFGFGSTKKNTMEATAAAVPPRPMALLKPKPEPASLGSKAATIQEKGQTSDTKESVIVISSDEDGDKVKKCDTKTNAARKKLFGDKHSTSSFVEEKQKEEKVNSKDKSLVRDSQFKYGENSNSKLVSVCEKKQAMINCSIRLQPIDFNHNNFAGKSKSNIDFTQFPRVTSTPSFIEKPKASDSKLVSVREKKQTMINCSIRLQPIDFNHNNFAGKSKSNIDFTQFPHVTWTPSFIEKCYFSDTSEKPFLPPVVSQCMEASRENGFFKTALDHGRPSLARKPNVELLRQLILLLNCDNVLVQNQAFSDIMAWTENYPPTSPSMINIYSDLFELTSSQQFLNDLLEEFGGGSVCDGFSFQLEFVVTVLEMNFRFCLHCQDKQKVKECLLVKWLWVHSRAMHHNNKTKKLLRVFECIIFQSSAIVVRHSISTLISLVAECLRLMSVHFDTKTRTYLSDTVTLFAVEVARKIRDACPKEDPFYLASHLSAFKVSWFRTLVTASLLSFSNDFLLPQGIEVRDISLTKIVSQYFFLLPPLSKTTKNTASRSKQVSNGHPTIQELSPRCNNGLNLLKDKNLTSGKVNKGNGKGESALHTAAIKGDSVTMKKLLCVPGVDVNLKDNAGWTPLHEACNHGRYECVEVLLKYVPPKTLDSFFHKTDGASSKVDINAPGDLDITPLHDAVMNNRIEISKLLLKYGGKSLLSPKTVKGYSALDLARSKEMIEVLNTDWSAGSHTGTYSLSQDSQSEDSMSLSQSEYFKSISNLPSDAMYDEVLLHHGQDPNSATYLDCSVFVSLVTLLLTSYLESMSVEKWKDGVLCKVSLLNEDEQSVFRTMKGHLKVFRKHLKKITHKETYDSLLPELLMMAAAVDGHPSLCNSSVVSSC